MSRPVVILMVKAPRVGEAKTRLVPALSGEEAASLAGCFARDVLHKARRVVHEVIIAYTPADARPALAQLLSGPLIWHEQEGADLGARLEAIAAHAAALGYGPLIIMGTDSPTLPASFIRAAHDALAASDADIALGPTEDGGYYLVGLRHPVPGLFQDIDWSTPRAYRQTASSAARLNLRLLSLQPWYDVDTPQDLARLRHEIFTSAQAQERAPATHQWLREQVGIKNDE
jgi:rSAM/selenodomain-associated transferase 1